MLDVAAAYTHSPSAPMIFTLLVDETTNTGLECLLNLLTLVNKGSAFGSIKNHVENSFSNYRIEV